ncbi:MAG: aspartate/tyrosine/aromatic aminotransferase [Planctomycetales bacterium]|nr:aspartate/tyrosine/aromatic aminotransferase [Planctomycetales bacterium]
MFENLTMAPPDAILGLTDAFKKDPNPNKINLSVGVYQDSTGKTPILESVKKAEEKLLATESNKSYLGIDGLPEYGQAVQRLLFGDALETGRAVTAQTPGGTGALRVAAEFIKQAQPNATVWCSKPTWANHPSVFEAAGLRVNSYPYIDAEGKGLDFDAMIAALRQVPAGDVVLLHACCHNPTGIDPTPEQWDEIGRVLAERRALPLVDFAYQGFGDGLRDDATGLLRLLQSNAELLVCSSFSKNFGLYSERTGALTLVAADPQAAQIALSNVKRCIRANYSNPPKHGAAIVATVLSDEGLTKLWESEVTAMRDRINGMRRLFVDTLKARGVDRDFSFLLPQRGMFSFSGLSPVQVDELRSKHAVYIVGSGRINVAGMTEANMNPLCDAIADVLK